ncbi:hypothetical protein [Sphingomonas sp.]
MNGGSRIIDLRRGTAADVSEQALPPEQDDPAYEYGAEDETTPPSASSAILAWLAVIAAVAWIGIATWAAYPRLTALDPLALVQFTALLCVPPALIGVLWLLAQRSSRAEAKRFAATAQRMRLEASEMEVRIAALSDRIDNNRAQLNEQTHALISAGEEASERLRAVGDSVVQQVAAIHGASRMLGESSDGASKRLAVMIATMPKARGETDAMADTLDRLALAVNGNVASLDAQLAALAERARTADDVTGAAAQRLAAHIARMEATSETAGARIEAMTGEMANAVDGVLDRAAHAIDSARQGITAQGEAMLSMLQSNHDALDQTARKGLEALSQRLELVEQAIGSIGQTLEGEHDRAGQLFDRIDSGIASSGARFEMLHDRGTRQSAELAQSVGAVTSGLSALDDAMQATDGVARATIGNAEALLTALDAAVREIDETLPQALQRLDGRVGESRAIVGAAKPELLALVTAAESTHDAIEAINTTVNAQRDTLVALSQALVEALATGSDRIAEIHSAIDRAAADSRDFADHAAPRLTEALARIRETAAVAAGEARKALDAVIPDAAGSFEDATAMAFARAFDGAVEQSLARLRMASHEAVETASRAAERVREQVDTIARSAAEIDGRIEQDRIQRETSERDSFGRRMSLLIEALNSSAIDIAKALSTDIADTAWAAYLKGDRGVFTRRAVRLLDPAQLREIAHLYDRDDDFSEQVNRYIHDFEAMLRQILAQRDGSPMGVTLLSSDSGKLYVALAQAIERLRT